MQRIWVGLALALGDLFLQIANGLAAEDCQQRGADIVADRPDTTNSSIVVPRGSLQLESGLNWTNRRDGHALDGPNARLRAGFAPCTEVLVDLPDYALGTRGRMPSGFSDVSPAIKRQLGPLPRGIELSATAGLTLPTGAAKIQGRGVGGYVQFPWSKDIGDGWSTSGMVSTFWVPGRSSADPTIEPTFVVEREVGPAAALFIEYVADVPLRAASAQFLNSGGTYRVTPTQQIDFHLGVGLNHEAPSYFLGVGYSFRFDAVF